MKFDAHVHLNCISEPFMKYVAAREMRVLSIITDIPDFPSITQQLATIKNIRNEYPGMVDFATTFSCRNWGKQGWQDASLDFIKRSIDDGAAGVKAWKNIGMSLRDDKGRYVLIDHPTFEPIFRYLEDNGILLLGHNGEPRNCWLPLQEMTVTSDQEYFTAHPEYHMYHHPEVPGYTAQLEARDRVLRRHPNLRFVGLHLASMEWSIEKVSTFLDEFPNAMVDLAERICHLQYQSIDNRQGVYDFFMRYQDRIIYGSDIIIDRSSSPGDLIPYVQGKYRMHDQFLRKEEWMTVPKVRGNFQGLGLPQEVIHKITLTNALATYASSEKQVYGKERKEQVR